jgi:sec-independent protein translocase protein TatC
MKVPHQPTEDEIQDQRTQTLIDHLSELRFRLTRAAYGIVAGMILCYNYTDKMFDIIRAPIAQYLPTGGLIFTGPADKFIAHLKLAFFGGMVLSCPFWLYQVWKFIAPGLYSREKKYSIGFMFFGTILFLVGVCFAYFAVFPAAFHFLMSYGGDVDKPMITIDQYLSFFTTTSLMFGVSFELPLIMTILGMIGLVSSRFLRDKRRYAVVLLSVVAAVITPPDLLSMIMMLIPLIALYEIGVWLVFFFEKKKAESLNQSID